MKKNSYLYVGMLMLACMSTTSCIHSANENVSSADKSFTSPTMPCEGVESVITPLINEDCSKSILKCEGRCNE